MKDSLLLQHPFRFYFLKDWKSFGSGIWALFFTGLFDAFPPYLIGKGIDLIIHSSSFNQVSQSFFFILLLLIITTLCLGLFRYLWRIFWGRFNHNVAEDLRNRVFSKFLDLSPQYYRTHSIGELMSLITNDVNSFRMAIGPGTLVLADALIALFIIPPLMISLSWSWTWKCLILMPVVPFLIAIILKKISQFYRQQQDEFALLSGQTQETISGIRVIKSYAQEINQTLLFNQFSKKYEWACNQVAKTDSFFAPVMDISVAVGSVILLIVGAPEVIKGEVSIGVFFTFYQYIQKMIWPMTALGIGFNHLQQGKASFSRIWELLTTPNDVPDEGTYALTDFKSLEVNNLTFTYPLAHAPTLKNVSFKIHSGEKIGLIGETGSGKTTLIELLCHFYPLPTDTLLINGISLEKIRKSSLRNLISLVPQDSFLFSKPIQENIAFARNEWTLDEIINLSKIVSLDEEIQKIPLQFDALLGEKGVNLSGGQKQRLTIARALMAQTPLVIFDDSLSAVDAHTEKNILQNLRERKDNENNSQTVTMLIVSNRIASIKWVDRIIVLKQGEIEATGTHFELLKYSPTYKHLAILQKESIQ